jgi:hypothetical protein
MPFTYQQSLKLLVDELMQSILQNRAYEAVWNCHTRQETGFFQFAFHALNENSTTHAMKILDRHRDAVGFWYIFRQKEKEIRSFCATQSISLPEIEAVADLLKGIRDRTHFHIDRRNVSNPRAVWRNAGLKNSRFTDVLESLWQIFDHLHAAECGQHLPNLAYTGSDVEPILRAVKEAGIVEIVFKNEHRT